MRHLDPDRRQAMTGTIAGAITVDGGPTAEQQHLLDAIATHLFAVDPATVEPLEPEQVAAAITDPDDRTLAAESLIVFELAHHPPSRALVDHVRRYLGALGADDDYQRLARDYVQGEKDRAAADFQRVFTKPSVGAGPLGEAPDALAGCLDALADCPPGSVGRSFHDFYERHGYEWPLQDRTLVLHDLTHVLAGYESVPEGEIALQAMLVGATGGKKHYPGLLASLLLFEVGMVPFNDLVPKESVLARPGAADLFGEALSRGVTCGVDFADVDLFELADRDLAEVRRELSIDEPASGPFTFTS